MSGLSRFGEAVVAALVLASITFLACGDDADSGSNVSEDGGASGKGGPRIPPRVRLDSGMSDSGGPDMDGSTMRDGSAVDDASTGPDMDGGDDMPMSGT